MVESVLDGILNCLAISFLGLSLLVTSLIMFNFAAIVNITNLRLRNIANNSKLQLRITQNKL